MAGTTSSNQIPKRGESWYNVHLPGSLIKWDSPQGQHLYKHCHLVSPTTRHFMKQINRTFCGPCSVAIIVNTLGLPAGALAKYNIKDGVLNEDDIANHPLTRPIFNRAGLERNGATLSDLASVTRNLYLRTQMFHVTLSSVTEKETMYVEEENDFAVCHTCAKFREICEFALQDSSLVIVNYKMESLGFKDLGGHFSPIGAYSRQEDMFLILDVWPDTPPAWVKTQDIFRAMATVDKSSNKTRGFIVLKSNVDTQNMLKQI